MNSRQRRSHDPPGSLAPPGSLDPPGSGLPSFENFMLNVVFKTSSAFMSDKRAMKKYQSSADELINLVDDYDVDYASRQTMIPRLQGIEDSSRNWSLYMVLRHLSMVDSDIRTIIESLSGGSVPHGEADVAIYKPSPDVGLETLKEFQSIANGYLATVGKLFPLRTSSLRYAHPWFGPLSAHGWHCLAAVHHRIHLRQARKIIAEMGTT